MSQQHLNEVWALARLAAAHVLSPECKAIPSELANAARLLGFLDERIAVLGTSREFTDRQEYDRVLAALRDLIGQDEIAALLGEGAAMAEERALVLAEA